MTWYSPPSGAGCGLPRWWPLPPRERAHHEISKLEIQALTRNPTIATAAGEPLLFDDTSNRRVFAGTTTKTNRFPVDFQKNGCRRIQQAQVRFPSFMCLMWLQRKHTRLTPPTWFENKGMTGPTTTTSRRSARSCRPPRPSTTRTGPRPSSPSASTTTTKRSRRPAASASSPTPRR